MKVKARYAFQHWTLGSILAGEEFDVDEETAHKLGDKVIRYETKPDPVAPLAGGQASDAGSLPPARPARKKRRSKKSKGRAG